LDEDGAGGAVGIPKTIGHIDVRDIWAEVQRTGAITQDTVNALRNRCVLPLLAKLEASGQVV
ncbi:MAG: hypothetical protein KGJ24_10425, partial [Burkholderiales bacterium]|nr:hypothetical protein [Burkholderiales bacterium]